MVEDNKVFQEELAIGIFVEGQHLHIATLARRKERLKLIDAQIIKLTKTMDTVQVQEEIFSESLSDYSDGSSQLDISEEIPDHHWRDNDSTADVHDNAALLRQLLQRYPNKKNKLAISLSEPQVYYSYYATDWGLDGKKLKQKMLDEIFSERQNGEVISPDALHVVRLKDGRLMGIVRDNEVNVLNLLDYIRAGKRVNVPIIDFVESSEISLVNLVNANYEFSEVEVSVIVYLGNEFSRLIFLKGNELYTISYIIGAGLDSENITNTIYSRILLEQDNLNLPQIDNIILTGECYEVGMKTYLAEKLPEAIKVDYLKLANLDVIGNEPIVSRFSVAIGSAWRVLNKKDPFQYDVNLLPMTIMEGQKRFKLGLAGWVLLILLPLMSLFATSKIISQKSTISQLTTDRQRYNEELAYLQDFEMKYNAKKAKYAHYQKAFDAVEAMSAGLKVWSNFLKGLSSQSKSTGNLWITDVNGKSGDNAVLKGYSMRRDRIPQLASTMGEGALKRVEVQEIRRQQVYLFEMEGNLPKDDIK
ncbi:MAG: hypothetical protein WAN36_01450 [Calditrichia bacterium]